MKICTRCPPPKSSSPGGGLAIASLKVFISYLYSTFIIWQLFCLRQERNMKIWFFFLLQAESMRMFTNIVIFGSLRNILYFCLIL